MNYKVGGEIFEIVWISVLNNVRISFNGSDRIFL